MAKQKEDEVATSPMNLGGGHDCNEASLKEGNNR